MGAYENVFGEGVQFDDNGDPIETGIGAAAHPIQVAKQAPAQEAVASQPAPVGATTAATPVEAAATATAETPVEKIQHELAHVEDEIKSL